MVRLSHSSRVLRRRAPNMGSRRQHASIVLLLFFAHFIKDKSCNEMLDDGGGGGGGGGADEKRGPYIDPITPNNVSAQLGSHAYLPCVVQHHHNKVVSWLRQRDGIILTVGSMTFIEDERIRCFRVDITNTWTLQVKSVEERDAGLYQCQVATEPKISHFIQLDVIVPKIIIAGQSILHVKVDSLVSFKCMISQAREQPSYIFWYHNERRELGLDPGARELRTEQFSSDTMVSTLIIHKTQLEDSGRYTCALANLGSASVVLDVRPGDPVTMQHCNMALRVHSAARALLMVLPLVLGLYCK